MDERAMQATGHARTATVMAAIRQRIASRALTPGDEAALDPRASPRPCRCRRRPSSKPMTGSSAEGRDPLAARLRLLCRRPAARRCRSAEIGPRLDRAVDPFWVSRQSLEAGDGDR